MFVTKKHEKWVRRVAEKAMETLGCGQYSKFLAVNFTNGGKEFHKTFACGGAEFGIARNSQITINTIPWKRLSYYQKVEIIDHEICHVVAMIKGRQFNDPHRGYWSELMKILGHTPREFLPWKFER